MKKPENLLPAGSRPSGLLALRPKLLGSIALSALLFCMATLASQAPPARTTAKPEIAVGMTLEQAVAKVQKETSGKVLQADTRQSGRITEYRIKVLTPDGHVRVESVRSKPAPGQNLPPPKHKENR